MPIQLQPPVYETYVLSEIDEKYGVTGESTTVTIRQATQAQAEQRQKFLWKQERKIASDEPGEIRIIQDITEAELMKLEVWLSLVECNIVDEAGKDLFPSKRNAQGNPHLTLTENQFSNAWGQLPEDVAKAIHDRVLELNIMWAGPEGEGS